MIATGEPYTAALTALLQMPDAPSPTSNRGEPAMTDPHPQTEPTTIIETSVPVLPARDIPETLALFERLGFTVRYDVENQYAFVRRGTIELHFTASPNLDPWNGAGIAFVRLNDASSLYHEFLDANVVPLVPLPRSELQAAERVREELRAKWDAGESIARMGEIKDQPWGIREFPLLDCNNNLIRFGQVLPRDLR
jgi:hypothetical protein